MRRSLLYLLAFYQKFLSLLGRGSCRYYPTCSEYAKWQVENNNLVLALWRTLIRILRCNQLFTGGIDYPVVCRKIHKISDYRLGILIKYWLVPCDKMPRKLCVGPVDPIYIDEKICFYVIKNFSKANKC